MPDISARFQTASQLQDALGIDMFLTGAPGAGKTTFIGSAADDEEYYGYILILDCIGGMRTLLDRDGISFFTPATWKDVTDTVKLLKETNHDYKVVAVDLVTGAYKLALEQVMKEGATTAKGQPTLEGYGVANKRLIDMVEDLRSLSLTRGTHVVLTSHTTETKDEETGAVLIRPNLTPGTLNAIVGACDVVTYLDIKKDKREMHLVGTNRYWAKVRRPRSLGPVPQTIEQPTFGELVSLLKIGVVGGEQG